MQKYLTIREARDLLILDPHGLDAACSTQPEIFNNIATHCSELNSTKDQKKEHVSLSAAKLSCEYREEASKKGDKITEAKLTQLVTIDPKHIAITSEWLIAKKEAEIWAALKESFIQRSLMIKELCSLYISGYFTDIAIRGNKNTEEVSFRSMREKGAELRRKRRGDITENTTEKRVKREEK